MATKTIDDFIAANAPITRLTIPSFNIAAARTTKGPIAVAFRTAKPINIAVVFDTVNHTNPARVLTLGIDASTDGGASWETWPPSPVVLPGGPNPDGLDLLTYWHLVVTYVPIVDATILIRAWIEKSSGGTITIPSGAAWSKEL